MKSKLLHYRRLSQFERWIILRREKGKCFYCGVRLIFGGDDRNKEPRWFTVDHKIPVSLAVENVI